MVSTAVLALAGFAWESQVSKLDETTVKVMTVRDDLAKEISNSEARISEHEKNDAVRGSEIAAIREDILELKERSLRIEAKLDRILMRVTRSDP
jgi:predicted  nucleic acid-binding Zn-ribbon protein